MSRQTQHKVKVNSIVLKKSLSGQKLKSSTRRMLRHRSFMLRHNEELKEEISIAKKDYYIATMKVAK